MRNALEHFALIVLTATALLICADILGWIDFQPKAQTRTVTISRPASTTAADQPYYMTICTPSGGCVDISIN